MAFLFSLTINSQDLALQGIIDFDVPTAGSDGKAIHVLVVNDIADLSLYGIGVANNGGGTDGQEYTFPSVSVSAGDNIMVARSPEAMASFLGATEANIMLASSDIGQNGDDAIELYFNAAVIETFGDVDTDGTGEAWEYVDSFAYKVDGAWVYAAINCTDDAETSATSDCPYTYTGVYTIGTENELSTFNVTFSVNTENITVGENGMYAGGGVLGGATAYAMTDDGTGTWTVTVALNEGTTGNYIFLNSPANDADWGTKESLGGQSCADANNYDDRILAAVTADTTLLHCFGNCNTDGTCAASTFDVTFTVNTASIEVGANGMYAGGGVLGDATAYAMSDEDGDGTWSVTVTLNEGTAGNYTFLNSPNDGGDWGAKEDISGQECADAANYNDRILAEVTADTTLQHCFGSCETDGTCPAGPAETCEWTLNLTDTYGDGWNGAFIEIFVNGDSQGVYETTSAAAANEVQSYTFYAFEGDVVTSAWTSGSYDGETIIQVVGPDGSVAAEITNGSTANVDFTSTVACTPPPSCAHTLNLTDTYGDGWNGAFIEIFVNGESVGVYETTSDAAANEVQSYTFEANQGDVVTSAWTSGSYDGETIIQIVAPDGSIVADITNGSSANVDFTSTVVCIAAITNDDLLAFLGSGSWRSDAETAGHIGVGPSGSTSAEWWNANPYDKAGTGLYDDRWSFADGVLTVDTGDDGAIFGKKAEIDAAFPDNTAYDADNSDNEYLYYTQDDYTDTFVADAVNNTITFATNGNLGFFTSVAGQEFQILEMTESPNTVYVRNVGSEGNAWYNRLTTADALSTVEAMVLDMRIYPNPSNGSYVTIQTPINGVKYVEVFDITGKRLINTSLSADTLDVSSMSSGMYLVKVTIEGQSKTSKLIIR